MACLEVSKFGFGFGGKFSDVVGEIPSGTISSQKTTRHVSIFRQDITPIVEELENIEAVFEWSWVAVLRCETIIDGDNDGGDLARELAANVVVGSEIGSQIYEAAAVEEDNDGEVGITSSSRDEKAEPEISRRIDGDVDGLHPVAWFRVGRHLQSVEIVH